jgi:GTP diphosphokinase / guanosine-3',5'-bis(diphosphate) 3'-diphosphatase
VVHSVLYKCEEGTLNRILLEIDEKFGGEVCKLLKILGKINRGTDSDETDKKTITRYILSNSEDIRPVLIKLSDVLDDVRKIEFLPEHDVKVKAEKVFDIYAPLSAYLNLEEVRKELEEIAFRVTKPEDYEVIEEKMEKEGLNQDLLGRYVKELENLTIDILDYKPKVFGRIKSKFSIYKKLKKIENEGKTTALSNINDRIAISIITQSQEDCFLVKMCLEEKAKIDEKKTDDYITNPKPNGFQALQISAYFSDVHDVFVEIQILSYKMYYINTYGPASHLAYKASKTRFAKPTDSFDWIKQLHRKIMRSKHLRKQSRSVPICAEIFRENVYIFTPKGRIIELTKGSTALDFAYRVHTKIGDKAMFANVDGKREDLDFVLKTGQIVEIITSNQDKYPNRDWLKFVKTDSAKEKIRRALGMKDKIAFGN